jgi:UDP-glucose:(heptosyl)LPS alpha-1,3-glucosyltransferase
MRFATTMLDFSRRKGGAERYLVDLCTQLVKEGDEVHVYTENWDEELQGIHFHRIRSVPFPKSLRLLVFALQTSRKMKQGRYDTTLSVGNTMDTDVLQPHGGVHWAWFWRSLRAYENPFFWTVKFLGRVLSLKQWMSGWIEDVSYRWRKDSGIIAISDMVKHDMMRWYHIPEGRIEVIYNGVDLERFHPRNSCYREEIRNKHGLGREFVFLFVSNNFRMKGLGILMEVLADLKKEGAPPMKLLILGRDRRASYVRLAKRLGISEEIVFAGSTGTIEKYYGSADLLVHPSFYDACSLTVFEALASGLPVVTASSNGASGIITQGKEGFVLPDPRDRQTLKQQLSSFFDPERREKAATSARRLAEQYSLDRNFRAMKNIFQKHASRGEVQR